MKLMKVHQFGSMDMKTSEAGKTYAHHYAKQIQDDIAGKISKSCNKRVNRELKSLKRDLPFTLAQRLRSVLTSLARL